jgi:hypothetical protein
MEDDIIRCAVCGSTVWMACRPATLEAWCAEHWPPELNRRRMEDDDMESKKGTSSSKGPERVTGTSGAAASHVVAKGAPRAEAGTNASKSSAMSQHAGAFKSRPGNGNTV